MPTSHSSAEEPIMSVETKLEVNVKQAVPFFLVKDMEKSLRYYLDGLGFVMKNKWTPDGKIRWCWLEIGEAALMLQEFWREGPDANLPKDGNGMWVTEVMDPDGYKLFFESPTDAPEESEYTDNLE
jgi:lactoylglutathione lyase